MSRICRDVSPDGKLACDMDAGHDGAHSGFELPMSLRELESAILAVIQRTADARGSVTMIRLATAIAADIQPILGRMVGDALARAICAERHYCAEDAGWATCDHTFGYRDAEALLARVRP